MRMRGLVTAAAILLFFRRVPKSGYVPSLYPVTFPTVAAEEPGVNICVTLGALKFTAEQGVIYIGYGSAEPCVLRVTSQTIFFRLVKSQFRSEQTGVPKFMALQTHLVGDSPPRFVAEVAPLDFLVKDAPWTRLRRFFIHKKPHTKGRREENSCAVYRFHGTHLRP
jgi:hypothetical protein